jgi:hypothetical protein
VTFIEGDVELAREWYGARGRFHECLMYPSNLYGGHPLPERTAGQISIQIGNSASPSNEHHEVLALIYAYRDENIRIYAPLSYGDKHYAGEVAEEGRRLFGDKFVPIFDFMELQAYREFLGGIDIAIFNHRRQQGLGNAVTLLGLGKKVYMRPEISSWRFFNDLNIKVFDIGEFNISPIERIVANQNQLRVRDYFSRDRLSRQLNSLFYD